MKSELVLELERVGWRGVLDSKFDDHSSRGFGEGGIFWGSGSKSPKFLIGFQSERFQREEIRKVRVVLRDKNC